MNNSTNASGNPIKLLSLMCLPILGAVIGTILGYFYFVQIAPQYKATAMIQLNASPTGDTGKDRSHSPRVDELIVMKTSAVLSHAVEIGGLAHNRHLLGSTAEEIVAMLKDPNRRMLDVKLGSKDIKSNIIAISSTTDNAELSGDIVQAVVAGYERHIQAESEQSKNASSKFSGVSSIVRLEIPTIGGFVGPYWPRFLSLGALLGLAAFSVLALPLAVVSSRRDRPQNV